MRTRMVIYRSCSRGGYGLRLILAWQDYQEFYILGMQTFFPSLVSTAFATTEVHNYFWKFSQDCCPDLFFFLTRWWIYHLLDWNTLIILPAVPCWGFFFPLKLKMFKGPLGGHMLHKLSDCSNSCVSPGHSVHCVDEFGCLTIHLILRCNNSWK